MSQAKLNLKDIWVLEVGSKKVSYDPINTKMNSKPRCNNTKLRSEEVGSRDHT